MHFSYIRPDFLIYSGVSNAIFPSFYNITIHWTIIRRYVRRKAWGFVQGFLENLNFLYPEWIDYTPWVSNISNKGEEEEEL